MEIWLFRRDILKSLLVAMAAPSIGYTPIGEIRVAPQLEVYTFIVKRRDLMDKQFHAYCCEPRSLAMG